MRIDTDINLLIYRRTKIVATLGPSSNDTNTIEQLITTGVNVFRLNMSHGTHESHRENYQRVRNAAEKLDRPVGIMADLCGPKIRVGTFKDGSIEIKKNDPVIVTTRDVTGKPGLIPSQYRALSNDVKVGNRILLDDGNLELLAQSVDGTEITCKALNSSKLSNHKGMNLPGANISSPSLTETDRVDAEFALKLGVDFLALSFVRRGSDIEDLRKLITSFDSRVAIVAKIEKPEALDKIDEILNATDAIMVARGDLGVELPPQAVPNAQEQLIDLAREYRKPVIVATQMLESMIDRPRPTRAEVSDVANAVRCGADAIMLSAETASGKHPVESVKMMDVIAHQAEGYLWHQGAFESLTRHSKTTRKSPIEDALAESTAQLSRDLLVRAIIVISQHDQSLSVMSASRPAAPIVGICTDQKSSSIAGLLWGVIPVTVQPTEIDQTHILARRLALELDLASHGQNILVVQGFSDDPRQTAPSLTVVTV